MVGRTKDTDGYPYPFKSFGGSTMHLASKEIFKVFLGGVIRCALGGRSLVVVLQAEMSDELFAF